MSYVYAFRWYGRAKPEVMPPREHVDAMLAELEADLRRQSLRPIACECVSWMRPVHVEPAPFNAAIGMVILRTAPGALDGSLRKWFVWQHPRWVWANLDLPELPERGPA